MDAVLLGQGHELGGQGRVRHRGGRDEAALRHLDGEGLEVGTGRDQQKEAARRFVDAVPGMGDVSRGEDGVARLGLDGLLADLDGEAARQDMEGLVLARVDVRGYAALRVDLHVQ